MRTLNFLVVALFFLMVSCESPVENLSAPTYGLVDIAAQFADESISTEQFKSDQLPPYGDTIRIQFPYYYPAGSKNVIDITNMRMTATLPVNVSIRPKLTVMDLTKENVIEVVNSDGTVDRHIVIGEIIK